MFFYFLYKNKKDLYKRQKDFGETKNSSLPFLTIFGICSENVTGKEVREVFLFIGWSP